ncbi:(2Fe-2S)-binding protein [Nocardia sp. NBC_00565]|uniref:2Fe-2S iron-sulfur cluster-binding protein n=1 Tax=Nocardia sp. NBC_00565 TaxID=2975993 RepID=UPI002E80BF73|nr:2Fe-2S iron-sulfur cluster-binding protein [Nocardia sp. NBC_00565]WUC05643.1 (2Fe-2S)-binding protein [Nocardia sp. NBC_00565]
MAVVRVDPAGFELAVRDGETLFEAALREGARWPTICYGQARCTACVVRVLDGHQHLGPIGDEERDVLRQITNRRRGWSVRDTRLACRLMVTGDITVEKRAARPAAAEMPENEE